MAQMTPVRRQEVIQAAVDILDGLLGDLSREEEQRRAAAGATMLPPPYCKIYEGDAAQLRGDVFRLLGSRRPRVMTDVQGRLEVLRKEVAHTLKLLSPHYRKDEERDPNLAAEYWRCALTGSDLRRALDEDWQLLDQCIRHDEQAEAESPSEKQWVRRLSPEERKYRRRMEAEGLGETLTPPFTHTERAEHHCTHVVNLLAQCCAKAPRPDPVVDEREVARLASRHGIPLDEARRLLWKSEQLLEPPLLEEESPETIKPESPTPQSAGV